jgi:hypothetical protein
LKRTLSEAPRLFQADPPTPPDNTPQPLPQARPRSRRKRRLENSVVQTRGRRPAYNSVLPAQEQPRTHSDTLIPDQPRDQQSQLLFAPPLSSTTNSLIGTYSCQTAVRIFAQGDGLSTQQGTTTSPISVRIFIAIERSDQKIEIQQLYRRACYYAFAQLHTKGSSVDSIVQEIENELPIVQDARRKVYNILRIGTKWMAIVEEFASIINHTPQQVIGLLYLLGSPSV